MFKKFMGLVLALMIVMSVAVVGFSAAQVEVADEAAAADDVAAQGADADVAPTGDGLIYFDAASAGWESASNILFYIHEIGGEELAAWGSKNKLGGTKGDNNIWSFDAAALGVVDGKSYGIIFNNFDTSAETYDLLLDTSNFGDTAKANPSVMIENPVDSNKTSMEARWTNSSNGPILQITSIGSLVGESVPGNTTKYQMFVNFLASKGNDGLQNAINFSNGKKAQEIIDTTAAALGLTQADVKKAIDEAKTTGNPNTGDTNDWSSEWDASKSSLPAGDSASSDNGSGSTASSSTSSSGSSTGSSGSSSSSTKSGSASNTQTGQTETVLFIMLGVMVAAAGVIFFARKRERA